MVYYAYPTMKISYAKNEDDVAVSARGETSSHLTAIAIAISIVFIVVALGLWFGFAQSKKTIESVPESIIPPVVSPEIQQARVYEAIDGLQQCHKNIADVSTAEGRAKRQKCYYAVMTIFTTAAICDLMTLDPSSRELCRQAETQFIKDYPHGIPQEQPQGVTNTNNSTGTSPSTAPNGTVPIGSGGGNANTGTGGGSSAATNGNTNTPSSATNTSSNTNTTITAGNTNTSGGTIPSANQNTNSASNTNEPPPPDEELCIIDTGEVVLLEHTNNCQ